MVTGARPLDGKVALVTGAARRLGRAFAEALAVNGAATVVADIADTCGDHAGWRDRRAISSPARRWWWTARRWSDVLWKKTAYASGAIGLLPSSSCLTGGAVRSA